MRAKNLEDLYGRYVGAGDVDALAELFDRLAPDLERLARRLVGDRHRAQDVVQETFLTALEQPGSFERGRPLRPWLVGILANRARDARRRAARAPEHDRLAARAVERPEASLSAAELEAQVERALGELPPEQRELVQARLLEDRAPSQLALELGLSPGALRARLHRGLQRLRASLPPGLATALAIGLLHSRGLGQVRARVLRRAGELAPPGAGSLGSGSGLGASWLSKELVLAGMAALLLVLGVGLWEALRPSGRSTPDALPELARSQSGPGAPAGSVRAAGREPARVAATSDDPPLVLVSVRDQGVDGPAAGFEVRLGVQRGEAREDLHATTDDSGIARFELQPGERALRASVDATERTTPDMEWLGRTLRAGGRVEVELAITGGAALRGLVVTEAGAPVPFAEVLGWCARDNSGAPDRRTTADAEGAFELEHLGAQFVAVARTAELACGRGVRGELMPGRDARGLELVLVPAHTIRGRVVAPDGTPVAGAEVWVSNGLNTHGSSFDTAVPGVGWFRAGRARTTSDADGRFELADLPRAEPRVHALMAPYLAYLGRPPTGPEGLELVLDPGLELRGRVLDADGQPAAGARVRWWPYWSNVNTSESTVLCDERGAFHARGMTREGNYAIAVIHDGHALHVEQPVRPDADGGVPVDVRLVRERALAGRVLDSAGAPVAGARVWVEGERELDTGAEYGRRSTWEYCNDLDETESDDDGHFRFQHLYAGEFTLHAASPADERQSVERRVSASTHEIEVRLDPRELRGVVLAGVVHDAHSGAPIPSFKVTPFVAGSGFVRRFASDDGRFELAGLPAGELELEFAAPGYATRRLAPRSYLDGEHRLDVPLAPQRSLTLALVDANGLVDVPGSVRARGRDGQVVHLEHASLGSGDLVRFRGGRAHLHGLPAELVQLELDVDGCPPRTIDVDLTRPFEGDYEVPYEPERRVTLELFFCAPGPDTSAPALEQAITDVPLEGRRAWCLQQLRSGALLPPSSRAAVDILDEAGSPLARATIEPVGGSKFELRTELRTAFGSQSTEMTSPVPHESLRLPARSVRLVLSTASGAKMERTLDLGAHGELAPLQLFMVD